ncbi:ribonuclease T2 family protein [Donghicola mangrovi]|uniref:Ribonuclease T2 n=1 Tax=Donghicola mangrovi TaxID=2729614 RepID=A0A850Q6F0_9RHOB|nr:ribonuclease T2 [Donghicola mangrovi]NVO24533.1 ribonuclease T2 [Donghicola mangrovi]
MRWVWVLLLSAVMAQAEGEKAGEFDYYVMSLSWSPSWCAIEGDARDAEQCDTDLGWSLHGLWPQFHRGYPSYCNTLERAPSRRETDAMADIMGSGGLAWHQWKKHGVCAGLSSTAYFDLSRRAYNSVKRPDVFRKLDKEVKLPATLIEEAFIKANPQFEPDMLTVTCTDRRIHEVRVCLSKDLEPVPCGRDVVKDCTLKDALFAPIR